MTDATPGTASPPPEKVVFKLTTGTLTRALALLRRVLGWLTAAYAAGLLAGLIALEWWGEKLWVLSLLLYAPPLGLLLPLLVLTPLCLLFRRRLLLWHLGCGLAVAFGYMTFGWSGSGRRDASMISAVTFNYGQSNRPQFADFLAREKPDFILLQDARNSGPAFAAKYPASFVSGHGEFVFVSRYPIQKAALLTQPNWRGGTPVAARFEVLVGEKPLVFYSVHLPTPRQELGRFLGGRRILGDLAGRRSRSPGHSSYREWLEERIALARALDQVFREEPLPFIVAGDFNTPDHGLIYHLFADEMTDAFDAAGRGWGLTFPGTTRNPIAGFGPWLRLDFFFAGRGWQPVECRPEPGKKSQHKAVLARFEPTPPK